MKHANLKDVLRQFKTLNAPLSADMKTLRHARNSLLHSLYEKSKSVTDETESLRLDQEIAQILHAYLYIKRHFHQIHSQLDLLGEIKTKFEFLDLPIHASIDDIRHRRNEILQSLGRVNENDNLVIDKQIHEIQHAYLFILENYPLIKAH